MICPCTYPAARERAPALPGVLTDRFRPHAATAGYVTLGTALADVLVFAGVPDRIELFTRDAAVVVQFTDRADVELDTIELPPGVFYEPGLVAEKIRARNAVAGVVGKLQVVGKYVHNYEQPAEPLVRDAG
jgi:hypothetical protein